MNMGLINKMSMNLNKISYILTMDFTHSLYYVVTLRMCFILIEDNKKLVYCILVHKLIKIKVLSEYITLKDYHNNTILQ
jgi:hypothetical protein